MALPFSIIAQDPAFRDLVQDNLLERVFHDALFPRLLFRLGATDEALRVPVHAGDIQYFTGKGLITPTTQALQPRTDPTPVTWSTEQWVVGIQKWAQTIDTDAPTSAAMIVDQFVENIQQLGLSAAQSLNRIVRNVVYNAAVSGATFCEATWGATGGNQVVAPGGGPLRVRALNGLTTARNPTVVGASIVRFGAVSATNPLTVYVTSTTGTQTCTVTGFTPDNTDDELGPGTITLVHAGGFTADDRAAVLSIDRTSLIRVGGGNTVDSIGANDVFTLSAVRQAVNRMRNMNVAPFGDGDYHAHLDPTSESQIFDDVEWQRLYTGVPQGSPYTAFAIGRVLGTTFFRNNECPQASNVTRLGTGAYTPADSIVTETSNASSIEIHRPLFLGAGGLREYYMLEDAFVTEAGTTGVRRNFALSNEGLAINTERISLIIRAPLDRLQELISSSWKYTGGFVFRTDAASGDAARIKRCVCVSHGA